MLKGVLGVSLFALGLLIFAVSASARDNIQIVGSSTVFPFAAQVAENFTHTTAFASPVVESTGTGGGFKLFCSGLGDAYPDITNASRPIKPSEIELCTANSITDIVEVQIGYDGIVIGYNSSSPPFALTRQQIFAALAAQVPDADGSLQPNPHRTWSDISPNLPAFAIKIYGPPPTSGTRDAFLELVLETGAKLYPPLKALSESDKKHFREIAHSIREDGVFIEAGENDNLIINKLRADDSAFGIFGYSFLEENSDKVQAVSINGTVPEFEAIAEGSYPLVRPLFFYVKKQHIGTIPGLQKYLAEFTSDKAWGEEGYLTDEGLIPLPYSQRTAIIKKLQKQKILK